MTAEVKRKMILLEKETNKALGELIANSPVKISRTAMVNYLILYARDTGLNIMLYNNRLQTLKGKE